MEDRFKKQLDTLAANAGVSKQVIGQVLLRVARANPVPVPRVDVAKATGLGEDLKTLSEGSISKAVGELVRTDWLVEEAERQRHRPGRPMNPVRLADLRRQLIGIHVRSARGHANRITGVLTGLDGTLLAAACRDLEAGLQRQEVHGLVLACKSLCAELREHGERDGEVLGVGVDVGGHVYAGTVVDSTNANWLDVDLADELETVLELPVVLENDVNSLAIWETHRRRFPETDFAMVAVFGEGVGGALALNGRIYRGARGMAGEIGHLVVEHHDAATFDRSQASPGFDSPCPAPCGGLYHLDCLATPARLLAELGLEYGNEAMFARVAAGTEPSVEEDLATAAFERGGRALGRALVSLVNLVNPNRILLLLPSEMVGAPEGTPAAAYVREARLGLEQAFSTGGRDANLTELAADDVADATLGDGLATAPIDVVLARASAACVLDAFIARSAGRIRPRTTQQRQRAGA